MALTNPVRVTSTYDLRVAGDSSWMTVDTGMGRVAISAAVYRDDDGADISTVSQVPWRFKEGSASAVEVLFQPVGTSWPDPVVLHVTVLAVCDHFC